ELRRWQLLKGPLLADGRITAVGADHEVRREVARPVRAVGTYSSDPVLRPDQIADCGTHGELEGRGPAGRLGQHGEDCRLGNEPADEAQRLASEPGSPPASLIDVDRVDDGLRELSKPIPEPHLVERVEAARLQSVAAKGSREVSVALEQRNFYSAAGEQIGETRSRRARTDDDDSSNVQMFAPTSKT